MILNHKAAIEMLADQAGEIAPMNTIGKPKQESRNRV